VNQLVNYYFEKFYDSIERDTLAGSDGWHFKADRHHSDVGIAGRFSQFQRVAHQPRGGPSPSANLVRRERRNLSARWFHAIKQR
jgi:hypothetical protein